jgi:uncharacterized RDD family membrane protein YckC
LRRSRCCYNAIDSRLPFGETSAAQNGTVIKTCQQCGAVNGAAEDICCFCDAPLGHTGHTSVSRRISTQTEGNLAVESEWRREVSHKLHAYRVRRHGATAGEGQSELPFEPASSISVEDFAPSVQPSVQIVPPSPAQRAPAYRKRHAERVEISIPNQEVASPTASQLGLGLAADTLFPVASLAERRRAALLDVALLLFSYGGMLALFCALGGRIGFNKLDAMVTAATLVLFYAQYFALFTIFGGATPGMMLRGLRVVSFDGSVPTSRQMVERSLGYLVSAGTCFLGFLWALWDEDQLCWQDRISQTYLTPCEQFTMRDSPEDGLPDARSLR